MFLRNCGIPVIISMGAFCVVNYLWNSESLGLYVFVPQALPVYMFTSLLSLLFLWDARRRNVVSADDVGMSAVGWKPWKRLLGLGLVLFFAYGGLTTLPDVVETPSWGDYLFWFMFLLPASLAELLVFITLAYCLPEAWLRRRGIHPAFAFAAAALFSAVTFGLYHYTHEPRWHSYALFPLIPVMLMNVTYFAVTRNFQMTMLLHNAFAAVGFAGEQYKHLPPEPYVDPATFQKPLELTCLVVGFTLPYLLMNLMENLWWGKNDNASPQ